MSELDVRQLLLNVCLPSKWLENQCAALNIET